MSSKSIQLTNKQSSETIAIGASAYNILLNSQNSEGQLAIIEMLVPPNGGPIPHEHKGFQECFYILEGEVEMQTKEKRFSAKQGDLVHIPLDGPVHCFKNNSSVNARLLCIVTPSGLDSFFEEAGRKIPAGTLPDPVPPTPEQIAFANQTAEKYGQKLYPKDYLD
ncbi:cupin domain-containing protein [Fluviicola taffensis]|uniref:Cupin 2 conserved barrel domain protein n=1 Tax=Fluviicola taffensis (strain DSM 16823 / NCIMB 13979 / RW262) TaxID=755732 RepID=F2IAX1_FLUTR|nr:cupin domain-containing protein [Fluviicola taffensis]AEA45295.1 Cupin 2 conserved barrel domain protein [Fluviicola taffensis DSM 16823]